MEKIINDFSIGLFISQTFVFVVLIVVVYYLIKLYKKVTKYIDGNSKI